jgi:hypothetical protein
MVAILEFQSTHKKIQLVNDNPTNIPTKFTKLKISDQNNTIGSLKV